METPSRTPRRDSGAGRRAQTTLEPITLASRLGLIALFFLLFLWMVKGSPISSVSSAPQEEDVEEIIAPVEEPELTSATLTFTGDFVGHLHVVNSVYDVSTESYDFTPIFQYAGTWMEDTDYLIGNLETTLSGGTYSGSPNFNSPDDLARSLSQLGYDLMTTANNHCLDMGFDGLSRTLDVLDENGLAHVGTYRSQEEFDENQGVLVQQIGELSVAFLDYTYGVNYSTVTNDFSVNRFNLNTGDETKVTLDTERLDADMEYARSLNTDLIIVLMHWGIEYETTENEDQDMVADYLIARGADAILGGHSHVPQPLEYRTVTGIDGTERTGFVCYSLGNLVSNQTDPIYTQETAALKLTLTKDLTSGEASVTDVTYTPLYLLNRSESSADPQYLLLDVRAAMADYEGSRTNPYITDSVYAQLRDTLTDLSTFFGTEWAYTESDSDAAQETASAPETEAAQETASPQESETPDAE